MRREIWLVLVGALVAALVLPRGASAQAADFDPQSGRVAVGATLSPPAWSVICAGLASDGQIECDAEAVGAGRCPASAEGTYWQAPREVLCTEEMITDPRCVTGLGRVRDVDGDGTDLEDAGACGADRPVGTIVKIHGEHHECTAAGWQPSSVTAIDAWAPTWTACAGPETWPAGAPPGAPAGCRNGQSWSPMRADCRRLIELELDLEDRLREWFRDGARILRGQTTPVPRRERLDIPTN